MNIIELRHPFEKERVIKEEVVLVLGFFDGVHRGHQAVIEQGKKLAKEKNLKLALMTFNQHPSIVFQKMSKETMTYLTSMNQKAQLFEKAGVDLLYVVDFTSAFAKLTPEEFIEQYIIGLHAKVVVAGFDYTFGYQGKATMTDLAQLANQRFEVIEVPELSEHGQKVSSTAIRQALAKGDMQAVNELLGYPYTIEGTVMHGDARGRTLGFPTANIRFAPTTRLPIEGVYVCEFKVGNTWHQAMGSIGHNDTFGEGRKLTVEVYILDFHQEIYGEFVEVRWLHLLREQIKFDGAERLIQQLHQDEVDTRAYFATLAKES
ncbi:bifunctional riboflavin kinase/FAD synthetase [Enterococcus cecorum]|uniref:bifunctional riboflavin kinase/FAD synthetase n=1 Tax=Enterococcus cecorum TaxID=44008 RepID=UPI000643D77E|nr:bifunctional riboflavin kinase/FAD synthetase [Enterococcus cecorum]KLO70125.1 riboflavin biosynthesis protein RibF [Enterococcus cecorum]CAI3367524.1 bifunctional riboflavin kinase/FAD synthetase [Enterococcus cecorum]